MTCFGCRTFSFITSFRFLEGKMLRFRSVREWGRPFRGYTTAVTGNRAVDDALERITKGRIGGWLASYEQFVGITEVKHAQGKVTQAEENFMAARTQVKLIREAVESLQQDMNACRDKMDRVQRGEPRYLELATEEHNLIQELQKARARYGLLEDLERDNFALLQAAVRSSHEKERARTERTKNWSIIGSVTGAIIGIVGSTAVNRSRMKELRSLILDTKDNGGITPEIAEKITATGEQYKQIQGSLQEVKTLLNNSETTTTTTDAEKGDVRYLATLIQEQDKKLDARIQSIHNAIKEGDVAINARLNRIGKLVSSRGSVGGTAAVGVSEEVQELIEATQKKLEWQIRINTLSTVVFVYAAFALTLPILQNIFRGP
ncbi:mitochondrial potassium channel-like [Branchiostoma lanceolatum]|uniref:mitochondrial potassium channel-like n=1 Tax=Branchiostoma lanceolatum TaxID=7740 RepID=UPI003453269B